MKRNAAVPERKPRKVRPILANVASQADICGLDRIEPNEIFDGEQLMAEVEV